MIADISVFSAVIVAILVLITVWLLGKFRLSRVIRYKMKELNDKSKTEAPTVPPKVVRTRRTARRIKRSKPKRGRRV